MDKALKQASGNGRISAVFRRMFYGSKEQHMQQPYDYKYAVPEDQLAADGHPMTIKKNPYVEEWAARRDADNLNKDFDPIRKPKQMILIIMSCIVFPTWIYNKITDYQINAKPGWGYERLNKKRWVFGKMDQKKDFPSYEELCAKHELEPEPRPED